LPGDALEHFLAIVVSAFRRNVATPAFRLKAEATEIQL